MYDFLYRDDKSSENYKITTADPRVALPNNQSRVIAEGASGQVEVTKLANGVTVVTEQQTFPS